MNRENHCRRLESMYLAAPINEIFKPEIEVRDGEATVEMELSEKFHHAAGGAHGAVYFKMLDDAAFFAASSLEREFFVLTASFTTYLIRPMSAGKLRSVGRVVSRTRTQFIAESIVYDSKGREAGRGSGIFVKGKFPLKNARGYSLPEEP